MVNVAIFFFFLLQGTRSFTISIFRYGAIPLFIVEGERLWTLLTSMFMHANIMHLIGNMIYLWVFGDNIEDALGHVKYLAFYLLGGLAASLTHIASLFVTLPSLGYAGFDIPAVGASGAISAVLGAYLLLYPRARIRTLIFYFLISIVSVPAFYYLGFWFLYQLVLGFFSLSGLPSGVAFWAHIGGFVAGLASIKILGVKPRFKRETAGETVHEPVRPFVVSRRVWKPFADVITESDKVRIIVELPGVERGEIELEVSKREVIVSAEHGETRYYGRIPLPATVVPEVQDFNLRNGVVSFWLSRTT